MLFVLEKITRRRKEEAAYVKLKGGAPDEGEGGFRDWFELSWCDSRV